MSLPRIESKIESLRIERDRPRRGCLVPILVLLLLAGAAGGGYLWWQRYERMPTVRLVAAERPSSRLSGGQRDRTTLNASGYVTARRDATVSSKVTGKVIEVDVEEGMRVEAGQILAKLDASNVETSLRLAEAQLDAGKARLGEIESNLALAERELARVTTASEANAATAIEVDRADALVRAITARLAQQRAEVIVAEREVAIWLQQLDDTIIRAPFAGVVTAKNAQPGEMISPMSVGGFTRTGICTLVDMQSLEIEVDVSESYINRVTAGQPVEATLDSYPEWKIPASVIAIIPTADRQKATVKVRVAFKELDPRILPDMSVKVAFQTTGEPAPEATEKGVIVPESAVVSRDGKDVVFVYDDGVVERRAVSVSERRNEQATVTAGLTGGERVVIDPSESLSDGARVKERRP